MERHSGTEDHCSKAYSTATQQASLVCGASRWPCSLRLWRVGKKASQAGHGCMLSSSELMLLWEESEEACERERLLLCET